MESNVDKLSYCIQIFCLILLTPFFQKNVHTAESRTLYAVSSLRCHLQHLNETNKDQFFVKFEDEDVRELWEEAVHSEYISLIEQAKYYYDRHHYTDALDHLDYTWDRLLSYQNFDKNPFINKSMKNEIAPYLLPHNHPSTPILDIIFSQSRVTSNIDTIKQAGFKILHVKDSSHIVVARHPAVSNYLFKIYPDEEVRTRLNKPSWKWLVDRCAGVEIIRKLIKKKKIEHFVVPQKWLYPLPPIPVEGVQHPILLLATDMHLVSRKETKEAWKTKVTKQHLDELYIILSHGCGSNFLSSNVPYTQNGKFTFIDTEYPHRKINLSKVKLYIDPLLHSYWDDLVAKGGKK